MSAPNASRLTFARPPASAFRSCLDSLALGGAALYARRAAGVASAAVILVVVMLAAAAASLVYLTPAIVANAKGRPNCLLPGFIRGTMY